VENLVQQKRLMRHQDFMIACPHGGPMSTPSLTPEQETHAQELAKTVLKTLEADILQMTRLLASKPDHQVLGQTEFQIRDIVHKIGAKTIQAELDARQKKGIKGRA
jgi:hypothetical protein